MVDAGAGSWGGLEWSWYPPYPAGGTGLGGRAAVGNGGVTAGPIPAAGPVERLAPEVGRGKAIGGPVLEPQTHTNAGDIRCAQGPPARGLGRSGCLWCIHSFCD